MALLRRFLVVQLLLFWQGGFLFYAAVVVPVATEQFGAKEQGFVTQRVTVWLNRIGWLALAVCAWDVRANRRFRPPRWLILLVVAAVQAVLVFWLHDLLSAQLDFDERRFRTRDGFYSRHAWYLILSTIQWVLMLAFAALTLAAWRTEDRWLMLRR
jgi:hypothetical protein